jgi:hypothetical protein
MPLLLGRFDGFSSAHSQVTLPPPQDSGSQTSDVRRMAPPVHPVTGKPAAKAKGKTKTSVTHDLEKALGLS